MGMAECNWHFITDAYDGPHQHVDISIERRGLVVTGASFDASKFDARIESGRIILERKPNHSETIPNVDRPTSPAA
jgi:hypothetical protein